MKYNLVELVDISKFKKLLESIYEVAGVASGITDPEGNMIISAGWQEVCSNFHKKSGTSVEVCGKSNAEMASRIKSGEKLLFFRCPNGPFHAVAPIIVDGFHIANIVHGQFFIDEPDLDYFARRSAENGFEVDKYMRAVMGVPVLSTPGVKAAVELVLLISEMIVETSMKNISAARRNEELVNLRAIADSANNAKSQFISNITHEIRTPLNSIIGFSDLLMRTGLNLDQREMAQYIKLSGKSLLTLVNDVFDFSRIESQSLDIEFTSFHMATAVAEAVRHNHIVASQKGIDIVTKVDDKIRYALVGDAKRLIQILSHLISNAVKFTQRGTVTVEISLLSENDKKSHIEFRVRDQGIGIDKDDIERLFSHTAPTDGSSTRKYGGAGIGLSLARGLVKLMGGEGIFVESTPGAGSVFHFSLVLERGAAASASADRVHTGATGETRRLNILVAEDNIINMRLMQELLKHAGHSVSTAENGSAAFELASREKFDLIFMDLQMPRMDGFESTKKIREAGIETPIIAMTAFAMRSDYELCIKSGMDEYISKPINANRLEELISNTLSGARARAEARRRQYAKTGQDDPFEAQGASFNPEKFIRTVLGKKELADEILKIFVSDYDNYMSEIKAALASSDFQKLRKCSHRLKGSSLNVSAEALNSLFADLEKLGKQETLEGTAEIVTRIEAEFAKYRADIEKFSM